MEFDSSTVLYIIAVVVYFLYSMFFNKQVPEQHEEQTEQPEARPQKKVSFDDLLKEIRREQNERERDLEGAAVEEEEFLEEESYRETPPVVQPKPKKYFTYEDPEQFPSSENAYQKVQERYQNYGKQPLVKLDDQVDIHSDQRILGEVEDVSGTARRNNKYAAILKNPQTVRDAVVVSEILRRKHF